MTHFDERKEREVSWAEAQMACVEKPPRRAKEALHVTICLISTEYLRLKVPKQRQRS